MELDRHVLIRMYVLQWSIRLRKHGSLGLEIAYRLDLYQKDDLKTFRGTGAHYSAS